MVRNEWGDAAGAQECVAREGKGVKVGKLGTELCTFTASQKVARGALPAPLVEACYHHPCHAKGEPMAQSRRAT